jgi:hypothetical protein
VTSASGFGSFPGSKVSPFGGNTGQQSDDDMGESGGDYDDAAMGSPIRPSDAGALTSIPESSSTVADDSMQAGGTTEAQDDASEKLKSLKAKLQAKKKRLEEKRKRATSQSANRDKSEPTSLDVTPPTSPRSSLAARNENRFASKSKQSQLKTSATSKLSTNATDDGEEPEQIDLENAKSLVGICPYMCPDDELKQRQEENDVQLLELPQPGTIHPEGWNLRNTAVKRFRRSAADYKLDVPEWVRPPDVLEMTCAYLEEWVMVSMDGTNYLEQVVLVLTTLSHHSGA